jgi:hypothetical protein
MREESKEKTSLKINRNQAKGLLKITNLVKTLKSEVKMISWKNRLLKNSLKRLLKRLLCWANANARIDF